jgi:uncharacterized protein (DUF433 family)
MNAETYRYIGPRPGSSYGQYFLNGTRTRAETVYRYTVGPDAQTAQQVAEDCDLPLEAVQECIEYCEANGDLLREESTADWKEIAEREIAHNGVGLTVKITR